MSTENESPPARLETVTIVGVGLIGGSLAAGLKKRKLCRTVIGCGRSETRLQSARDAGLIDEFSTDLAAAVANLALVNDRGRNLVVFCTPVDRIVADVRTAAAHARPGTLFTDVGSVKTQICRELGFEGDGVTFVGSHPLAGSEKQGFEHADADLFDGKLCVVTPTEDSPREAVERVTAFWQSLGMTVVEQSPEMHDRLLATTSHVPHLIAAATATLLDETNAPFAASGFRDSTRIAAGDPSLWTEIVRANAGPVLNELDRFLSVLQEFRNAAADGAWPRLQTLLQTAKTKRDALKDAAELPRMNHRGRNAAAPRRPKPGNRKVGKSDKPRIRISDSPTVRRSPAWQPGNKSMLWELEIRPKPGLVDREAERVLNDCREIEANSITEMVSGRSFLIEGDLQRTVVEQLAREFLVDDVVEIFTVRPLSAGAEPHGDGRQLLNVLFKPGVTDNVGLTTETALRDRGLTIRAVATCRKYWINGDAAPEDVERLQRKVLANDAIERVVSGPLRMTSIAVGSTYEFELKSVPLREMPDDALSKLSTDGQLYLSLAEMQAIQRHFQEQEDRDPTDVELETIAQTWSEHCSHKTLAGRIHYRETEPLGQDTDSAPRDVQFENMLKETIFAATRKIREQLGDDDWCVSVFKDNAGIVKFDETQNVCFKVETHNHPSALEPYGGANTGIGGVIRDPLGTGLGAKPVCNTDVFCFAPPETPHDSLPPGVLHPKVVAKGVVSGVRDYGNRMGIPTVNGAVFFDERYLGNPLVYCGNVALIPADKCEKHMQPGDLIVAVGGRTGRDGIHGATFSSAELTDQSESLSGGAVQIGNAITEKMVLDVVLEARNRGLFSSITDCGAGGFSSAVGEMGAETGAEVWLEKAPLKYSGLSYTEIWISEAQERMVLAVPPDNWVEFHELCESEGVEATIIGKFTNTKRLVLKYQDHLVADLSMQFLHHGRPPVVREAVYSPIPQSAIRNPQSVRETRSDYLQLLTSILSSPNVCSKEWIIRQYDHEVQAGSVVKPLVGASNDGPSDAAVIRPVLTSNRGLAIANGMNPRFGDLDPYWMAASAIDEAVRNCVAVGADPKRIAILDNFCWGNTEKPEVLGSLVRAAIGCHDTALAYGTPFISGKDSLNNEFSFVEAGEPGASATGVRRTVTIPPSLLISALGQLDDVNRAVTMDLKQPGNLLFQIGETKHELGGSHYSEVGEEPASRERERPESAEQVPRVDFERAPRIFAALHHAISRGLVRSCHDLSEGGLAAALAEMAFAGEFGVDVDISSLAAATGLPDDVLLFSESNTRFVVEVELEHRTAFESGFNDLPLCALGNVTDGTSVRIANASQSLVDAAWSELKAAWQSPV